MEQIITIFKEKIKDINTEQNFIDYKNIFFKEYFGPLYDKFKTVKNEEKKELGKQINLIKQEFEKICETSLAKIINDTEMKNHIVDYDITLNTATLTKGSLHPSTLIFKKMLE
jgi:phenylalanyl-tRNA synthetase alpha subunit